MSGVAWQQDPSGAWDIVTLGGFRFTGSVDIGGSSSREIKKKGRKGFDGRVIKDEGYDNAEMNVAVSVATQEDFARLQKLIAKVHPRKKGGTSQPVELLHPSPNMIGVFQVFVRRIHAPVVRQGILTLRMDVVEWIPVPKKKKTKQQVKSSAPALDDGVSICGVDPSPLQLQSGGPTAVACVAGPTGAPEGGCLSVDLNSVDEQFMQSTF